MQTIYDYIYCKLITLLNIFEIVGKNLLHLNQNSEAIIIV